MSFFKDLGEGIGSFIDDAIDLVIDVFAFAFSLMVLPIVGLFLLAVDLVNYGKDAWERVKEKFKGKKVKPTSLETAGANVIKTWVDNTPRTEGNPISKELLGIKSDIDKGNISGMNIMTGVDEYGNETILDAQFFKSEGVDSKVEDADRNGRIVHSPIQ